MTDKKVTEEQSEFYLRIDFFKDDIGMDAHASQEQMAMAVIAMSEYMSPEIIGGLIGALDEILRIKASDINDKIFN